MNSVKMRDLKSNSKLNGKQSSSLSSKSFKTLLSKSSSRRTKRSSLQVVNGVLKCYLFVSVSVAVISLRKQPTFRDPNTGFPAKWRLRNERINSILIYYLLLRSLRRNVRPRPYVLYQGRGLTFPCMTERTRLISYLLHGLFIMDQSLRSIKTNNWSAGNFKKHVTSNEFYTWARDRIMWQWSADTLFDSWQLTYWMSTVTVKPRKPWTPEIFLECYCAARKKPVRREKTKPQARPLISLWFCG